MASEGFVSAEASGVPPLAAGAVVSGFDAETAGAVVGVLGASFFWAQATGLRSKRERVIFRATRVRFMFMSLSKIQGWF